MDISHLSTGNKSDALLSLVKQLKSEGVPIDGIGFESHFEVGGIPANISQNMERFVAAGVEVAITELDIRMTLPETDALLQQQKEDYQTVISACNSVKGCIGVTVWEYTDKVTDFQVSLFDVCHICLLRSTLGFQALSLAREMPAPGTR